jgi:hypothetical protein
LLIEQIKIMTMREMYEEGGKDGANPLVFRMEICQVDWLENISALRVIRQLIAFSCWCGLLR